MRRPLSCAQTTAVDHLGLSDRSPLSARPISGWQGQGALFGLLISGAIRVHTPPADELQRISELMAQYQDRPMDFADAALVALAEREELKCIFTLDDDFYFYRIKGRDAFDVLKPDLP